MSLSLRVYHLLPNVGRTMAVNLQGWLFRRGRYGPETDRLVEEAIERESWTPEQWKKWKEERLARILHRAATQVPYYRDQWQKRRAGGDKASWEYLENWPILEKQPLRHDSRAFVADDCDIRNMVEENTSGSTGSYLRLWRSQETVRMWYAIFEARARKWYGVSRDNRWAIMGGRLVAPAAQRKPPFWVYNRPLKQLYMSSFHLAPDLIPHYIKAYKDYGIEYVIAYPSNLETIGRWILQNGDQGLRFKTLIVNAEPLEAYQREIIEKAFKCPVRETYGMSEIVAAASECASGTLHMWPEAGWMEVLDQGQPAQSGELVCTGLLNPDMPLVRYRVGDRATFPAHNKPCGCGRTLPAVLSIDGRNDDAIWTPDGRRIGRLDAIFKRYLPVDEAQVIQDTTTHITLKYVPGPKFQAGKDEMVVYKRVQEFIGNMDITLEKVDRIPRGANSKFRAILCKLPPEEIKAIKERIGLASMAS